MTRNHHLPLDASLIALLREKAKLLRIEHQRRRGRIKRKQEQNKLNNSLPAQLHGLLNETLGIAQDLKHMRNIKMCEADNMEKLNAVVIMKKNAN